MSDPLDSNGIAIVGMAGRFPGAPDVDTFWKNLCAGVESVRSFSADELRAAAVDVTEPGFVNAGSAMADLDLFDAGFFGMSRREAEVTDPQHRVVLETAWAALEQAGYEPGVDAGRVGIFGGVAVNLYYRRNLRAHPEILGRIGDVPLLIATEREYAITRTAYRLGLEGPAVSVNTACSTSAVATHLAVQSLLSGETDVALAGGAYIKLPALGYIHQEGGILSADGHVRAFDADASGTVMASGVAFVALKRLADAIQDGDTIYAVIRGTAINNDGAGRVNFTAPGVAGQSAVITEAMAVADVDCRQHRHAGSPRHSDLDRRSDRGDRAHAGLSTTHRSAPVLRDRLAEVERRSPRCCGRRRGHHQGGPVAVSRADPPEHQLPPAEPADRLPVEPVLREHPAGRLETDRRASPRRRQLLRLRGDERPCRARGGPAAPAGACRPSRWPEDPGPERQDAGGPRPASRAAGRSTCRRRTRRSRGCGPHARGRARPDAGPTSRGGGRRRVCGRIAPSAGCGRQPDPRRRRLGRRGRLPFHRPGCAVRRDGRGPVRGRAGLRGCHRRVRRHPRPDRRRRPPRPDVRAIRGRPGCCGRAAAADLRRPAGHRRAPGRALATVGELGGDARRDDRAQRRRDHRRASGRPVVPGRCPAPGGRPRRAHAGPSDRRDDRRRRARRCCPAPPG